MGGFLLGAPIIRLIVFCGSIIRVSLFWEPTYSFTLGLSAGIICRLGSWKVFGVDLVFAS